MGNGLSQLCFELTLLQSAAVLHTKSSITCKLSLLDEKIEAKFELDVLPYINKYKMSTNVISVFYMQATAYGPENSDLGNISC